MKKLIFFLLFTGMAQAAPISSLDYAKAAIKVAYNIQVKCDCTVSTNANGVQYVSNIGAIYAKWTVDTTNYCSKTMAGDLFMGMTTTSTVGTAVSVAPGALWAWSIGTPVPTDADPWCLQ